MKTKIRPYLSFSRLVAFVALMSLIIFSMLQPSYAQEFIRGYASDDPSLEKGMIVRLNAQDSSKVEALKAKDVTAMHGVIVDAQDAAVTFSSENQKTFVATSGKYEVLVSNQNGTIHAGDYITISSVDGVGAKADDRSRMVAAKALVDADAVSRALRTTTAGGQEVGLVRLLAEITVGANPLYQPEERYVPAFLQNIASNVGDKPISPFRLYVSLLILVASVLLAGAVLFSGVRGGLVAIGRNPLSRQPIVKGMVQVIITGLLIFLSGLFAVYLVLKL